MILMQNQQLVIFGPDGSIFTLIRAATSIQKVYFMKCLAAFLNASTLIVHLETFHFLRRKSRNSSETLPSQV